jgi:hypothetical protein
MELIQITPTMAAAWLVRNSKNRPLSEREVNTYAKEIREGRWMPNGETIKFDRMGNLLDGQHRLHACIIASRPFRSYVVYDIDSNYFDTIDGGKKRTAGDVLAVKGVKNATKTAAAIRWVLDIRSNMTNHKSAHPSAEVRAFWETNPRIEDSIAASSGVHDILAPGIAGALHFLFSERSPKEAEDFFYILKEGVGLHINDAAYVLRESLTKSRMQKLKLPSPEIVAKVIRAWNNYRGGIPTKVIKGLVKNDDGTACFPKIA